MKSCKFTFLILTGLAVIFLSSTTLSSRDAGLPAGDGNTINSSTLNTSISNDFNIGNGVIYFMPCCGVESDRNVGLPPLTVNFWTDDPFWGRVWYFGDLQKGYDWRHSQHTYWDPNPSFDNTPYDVSLNGFCWSNEFIKVYQPSECSYGHLRVVSASPAHFHENWDNAIDGDTYWYSGTASVTADGSGKPWAIFEFTDKTIKPICNIRLLTETGICNVNQQVRHFKVYVSTTGTAESDFTLLMSKERTKPAWECFKALADDLIVNPIYVAYTDGPITRTSRGCPVIDDFWQEWAVPSVDAKYIKLVIDTPQTYWRQFGEFEVYTKILLTDAGKSSVVAEGAPIADGLDSAKITLTLADAGGNPVTGCTFHDIGFYCYQKPGMIRNINEDKLGSIYETSTPGVYLTSLRSTKAGSKVIKAVVNGVVVDKTMAGGSEDCKVTFTLLGGPLSRQNGPGMATSKEPMLSLLPQSCALEQNYPNPFNAETTIRYYLTEDVHVTLRVMDVQGRTIAKLVDEKQNAGYKSVKWNAAGIPSGIYIYYITAGDFKELKWMTLLK